MTGGLLQVASFGSQDIFLTGHPQITLFKSVFRRHTNFSSESIEVNFDDYPEFGKTSHVKLPLAGDLISKIYLKIVLPQLNFQRVHTTNSQLLTDFETAQTNYYIIQDYAEVMLACYRLAIEDYEAENVSTSGTIQETIEEYFVNGNGFSDEINDYNSLTHTYNTNETNLRIIGSDYESGENSELSKEFIKGDIDRAIYKIKQELDDYYYIMLEKERLYNDDINENVKIAWVDRIGHAIIDYIDLSIGGNKIDRHYGEWLTILYELTENNFKENVYKKLIGHVSELITFDRTIKPEYTVYIPLQFWFCRNYGLALPILALQYHDVTIDVKLREFKDLVYLGQDEVILYNEEEFSLDELTEEEGLEIQMSILVDYIFLDSPERRKFATSSHEYLIEQVHTIEFTDQTNSNFVYDLDFFHPCKEFIWTVHKKTFRENNNGYTKTHFDKFGNTKITETTTNLYTDVITSTEIVKTNPIKQSFIDFNGHNRVPAMDGSYFNYVIPYSCHSRSPSDGINVYNFSLHPEEHQPSGQVNMSLISSARIGIELEPTFFDDTTYYDMRFYGVQMNILRFMGGLAGLAYIGG